MIHPPHSQSVFQSLAMDARFWLASLTRALTKFLALEKKNSILRRFRNRSM